MSDGQWFYFEGDTRQGPLTAADLQALLEADRITLETFVWRKGMDGTGPIDAIPELKTAMSASTAPIGPDGLRVPLPVGFALQPKAGAWSRFLARQADIIAFGLLGAIPLYLVFPGITDWKPLSYYVVDSFVTVVLALLVEIPVMALTGSTFGKWLFGLSVRRSDGRKISLPGLARRNLLLWVYGWGLGLPLVNLIRLWFSYGKAATGERCPWDERPLYVVRQKPIGKLRWGAGCALVLGLIGFLQVADKIDENAIVDLFYPRLIWTNPETQVTTDKFPPGWAIDPDTVSPEVYGFSGLEAYITLRHETVQQTSVTAYVEQVRQNYNFGDYRGEKVGIVKQGIPWKSLLFYNQGENGPYEVEVRVWQTGMRDFWRLTIYVPTPSPAARKEADAASLLLMGTTR